MGVSGSANIQCAHSRVSAGLRYSRAAALCGKMAQAQPVQAVAAEGGQQHQPGEPEQESAGQRRPQATLRHRQAGERRQRGADLHEQHHGQRSRRVVPALLQQGGQGQRQHAQQRQAVGPARRPPQRQRRMSGPEHPGDAQGDPRPLPRPRSLPRQDQRQQGHQQRQQVGHQRRHARRDAEFDGLGDRRDVARVGQHPDQRLAPPLARRQPAQPGPGEGQQQRQADGEAPEAGEEHRRLFHGIAVADEAGTPGQYHAQLHGQQAGRPGHRSRVQVVARIARLRRSGSSRG